MLGGFFTYSNFKKVLHVYYFFSIQNFIVGFTKQEKTKRKKHGMAIQMGKATFIVISRHIPLN